MTAPTDGPPAPATPPESRLRDRLWISLLIGLCCMLIYNANRRSISAGDTYPARYLPFAIVQYHTIYLDPVEKVAAQGRGDGAYWMLHRPDGHILSLYPIVAPVLVSPLYLPAVGYLHLEGWTDARLDHMAKIMEKLSASFLASLSAALLYLLLRRRANPWTALLLTIAYALGTTTWVVSSQALWQHGVAEVLVVGALLCLTGPCTAPSVIAAGLLLGLIAGNRPPDVVLGAALGLYGLFWAGRRYAVLFAMASALPMLAVLAYNLRTAGNVAGGYGVIGTVRFFQHDLLTGVAGLLVSPTKGLFVFSPFLLFLALAWRYRPRGREERLLTLAMIAGVVIQILLYAKTDWRGGLSWGPRYMTDFLPFLMWMLVPVVAALRGIGRIAFLIAVGVSIIIEGIGALSYSWPIDQAIYAADVGWEKHDMRGAFRWRNAPFLTAPRHGVAPADLAVSMHGTFDAIESEGHATNVITAGQPAFVSGWALAGQASPAQVAVSIDGRQTVVSSTFLDRPDVRAALHAASRAGWRIPIDTTSLTPGEHHLTAMAWSSGRGEGSYLDERTLTVRMAPGGIASPGAALPGGAASQATGAADLDEDFSKAVGQLRQHQQRPGYWLTAYTSQASFHDSHPEMNTFLTALLVDLLNPIAAPTRLEDSLQRARQHLTNQIESGGLVRYHGLPNAPTIGVLGCAITPDTDNTALVWRIAPAPDRARLTTALATIDQYRTHDGLYRTWLAPRDAYQCLDPGSDPDPADIAIQMHLLLLLAEVRPPAAHALCEALRPLVDQDRIWVYYRKTPLVPMLRLTDLHRVGCDLALPESRMRTSVPGQQIWVSVVRMLGADAMQDPVLMRAVLRELARDDFALIRTNPPLLFHNDLTATVSRYYWSEDVGYALWLRLYDQYEHSPDPHAG